MVRSKYDGKLYRSEIAAYRAMVKNECGECSRLQAELQWEQERNAYECSGGLAGIGPKRPFVEKV